MTRAAVLMLTGSALLLAASTARARSSVEAGADPAAGFGLGLQAPSLDVLSDRVESLMNQVTQQPANVPQDAAAANLSAFLAIIRQAEGTANQPDPYRVCYGYSHTIRDLREHPAITGEWRGQQLPDTMCKNAGFGPGCISSAAGAYQIIRPTWISVRDKLGLPNFGNVAQDRAAVYLIEQRGALEDAKAGRLVDAVHKCRNEWASLPGNYARQGQRSLDQLAAWFTVNGGTLA
jgi:muramidase (phage lysozyme)